MGSSLAANNVDHNLVILNYYAWAKNLTLMKDSARYLSNYWLKRRDINDINDNVQEKQTSKNQHSGHISKIKLTLLNFNNQTQNLIKQWLISSQHFISHSIDLNEKTSEDLNYQCQ